MNALFLIRDPSAPSPRYRALQYIPYLEAQGVRVTVEQIPSGWFARRRLLQRASEFDTVLLQKRLLPVIQIKRLRRYAKRLVFDFDDAIPFRSPGKGPQGSFTRRRRFAAVVSAADAVIAGNSYLLGLAEPYTDRAVMIPTCLDPEKYDQAAHLHHNGTVVTLGWIGSHSTLPYLVTIREALEQVGARHPRVRLVLVCDDFPEFRHIAAVRKEWREATEAQDVASFDIGLAPTADDPWSRGKCGLKILQYMAASRPVVCSPFGVHKTLVHNNVNGFLADGSEEWTRRLLDLIQNPQDRHRMGAAGRALLGEKYTLARNAPAFRAALTGI